MRIGDTIIEILAAGQCEGNNYKLPPGTLDRRVYVEVNRALECAGGKWSRNERAHVFPDDAGCRIDAMVLTGEVVDAKRELGFFRTGPEIVAEMVRQCEPVMGLRMLEPSAGDGAIALAFANRGALVHAYEIDEGRATGLAQTGKLKSVTVADFLKVAPMPTYDLVAMNPPFARSADIAHISHAIRFLKPGGILMAVASAGARFRTTRPYLRFRNMLEGYGAMIQDLPERSFQLEGTGVRTCLIGLRVMADALR